MVDEVSGSPEWDRIQAKVWCSLPSANLERLQRVENEKLWRAFEGPVTEYRDAGGHVCLGHHASGVKEVCVLRVSAICYRIIATISQYNQGNHTVRVTLSYCLNVFLVMCM